MTHHDQLQIDREQDAVFVLATIISYGTGLVWTKRTIAHVANFHEARVDTAVCLLERNGYISISGGRYDPTQDGREYYQSALRRATIGTSLTAWKDEVLTGMDRLGERTSIDTAALPGPVVMQANYDTPERIMGAYEVELRAKKKVCRALGIDLEEYARREKDGSLHLCRGFDKIPHIGIFGRRGKGWQHLCKACRKRQRNSNMKG